ncbi:MAG: hypothetical protein IKO74_02295 [Selenomonadaceae bacterium]|nr:hypothetical protein [Selenomonadaceae bacterium]MBR4641535.1 hypothetical protein [Selenomonadaceae bacterium]
MRTIKFRGRAMNGDFVYGLLTKKKIRSSGEIRYAIATGNCTAGETIPVNENSIAQLVGYDANGKEIYEGDKVTSEVYEGEYVARLTDNLPPHPILQEPTK